VKQEVVLRLHTKKKLLWYQDAANHHWKRKKLPDKLENSQGGAKEPHKQTKNVNKGIEDVSENPHWVVGALEGG
jgi:hypothetical protein